MLEVWADDAVSAAGAAEESRTTCCKTHETVAIEFPGWTHLACAPSFVVRFTRGETLGEQKDLARMCYDEQREGRSQARVTDKRGVAHW